ncbi:hypothetical protein [Anaerosporobacter faecicola]|uniref:hypothetical protein n=1 Tax=Anaerosporobacter faecicola TaxID=2718714 RepID=UPI00143BEAA3|nr:hypothetical protein [Anaerosporobacter faecicola]
MIEKITFGTTNVTPKRILENSESLTITFESSLTYEQIKTLLSNKDNTRVITYTRDSEGQTPYTHNYNGYTVLQPTIGVGEGEYTVTLNQPNLQQKYDELKEENEQLKAYKVALEERITIAEGCILELSEVIYATETTTEGGE